MDSRNGLGEYRRKRNFGKTAEPRGASRARKGRALSFVIQQHHARRLHWDFRLEFEGVLKSWAVTREPNLNPADRHLAIETEDHPLEYGSFHGKIPAGEYGAGTVKIWDRGTYEPKLLSVPSRSQRGRPRGMKEMLRDGLVEVTLRGKKLRGRFVLVRTRGEGARSQWLFFKAKPKPVGLRIPEIGPSRRAQKR